MISKKFTLPYCLSQSNYQRSQTYRAHLSPQDPQSTLGTHRSELTQWEIDSVVKYIRCNCITAFPPNFSFVFLLLMSLFNLLNIQAVLKRRIARREPSQDFLKSREQMYFPGWHNPSPPIPQIKKPRRSSAQSTVRLPPLQPTTKVSD